MEEHGGELNHLNGTEEEDQRQPDRLQLQEGFRNDHLLRSKWNNCDMVVPAKVSTKESYIPSTS